MRKIICLFFIFITTLEGRSQSYIPMLTDSNYWDLAYSVVGMVCNEFGTNGGGPYRYQIDGDTLINGIAYKKFKYYEFIRVSQISGPNCPPFYLDTVSHPGGFMREDTALQKVYLYTGGTLQEELWYDFDVQVGDSVDYGMGWPTSGPFSVDTIYYITTPDGLIRKVIQCNDANISLCGFYIEGIGGIAGPFLPPYYVFEEGYWLMCAGIYNQQSLFSLYGNASYYCGALTSAIDEYSDNFLNVTPNPAKDYILIDAGIYPVDVTISDIFGKTIQKYNLQSSQSIDISILSPAAYFVSISGAMNKQTSKMIIKL